jgi:hypothetical protein
MVTFAGQQNNRVEEAFLVGQWTRSEVRDNGGMVSVDFEILANHTFYGKVKENGVVTWSFAGTWSLVGNKFTWRYEQSSVPLSKQAKTDIDYIIDVTPTHVRKRSSSTNKEGVWKRLH